MVRGSASRVIESVPQTTSLQKATAARTKSPGELAASAVSLVSAQKASTLRQMSSVRVGSTSRTSVQGMRPSAASPISRASGCAARNAPRRSAAPG